MELGVAMRATLVLQSEALMTSRQREEVVEEVLLEFDVGEVMMIIPQVGEVDLIVGSPRQPLQLVVEVIELGVPTRFRAAWDY